MTPQQKRRIRIGNDFQEMQNIQGAIVQWKAARGTPPHIDAYEITAKIRTVVSAEPVIVYRDVHHCYLQLPANYPEAPPEIFMRSTPPPFHPNWFVNGKWCFGTWHKSEGLGHYVIRMLQTLQYAPDITNVGSAANRVAAEWYVANRRNGLFPCDRQTLPDPTHAKTFMIEPNPKAFDLEKP